MAAAPKGLGYTPLRAQKAAEKGAFVHVGGKTAGTRLATGAARKWAAGDDTIFNLQYRISGSSAAVHNALAEKGMTEAEIRQVIASAITSANAASSREWQSELAQAEAGRAARRVAGKGKATVVYDAGFLQLFAQNLATATVASDAPGIKGATTGRASSAESLAQRYEAAIKERKVLNVSKMDATGKLVRKVAPPTDKSRTTWAQVADIAIISDNLANYQRALQLIFRGQLANEAGILAQAQQQLASGGAKTPKAAAAAAGAAMAAPAF